MKDKKIIFGIMFLIIIILILFLLINSITKLKDKNIIKPNNDNPILEDDTNYIDPSTYNIDFDNLENSKIVDDTKINISNYINNDQIFHDIDVSANLYDFKISNMEIYGDKYLSYAKFDITNESEIAVPEFSLDIAFYNNNGKDLIIVLNKVAPKLEPNETKTVIYESTIDITNADYYDIS